LPNNQCLRNRGKIPARSLRGRIAFVRPYSSVRSLSVWRIASWLVPIVLGLGGSACGEITGFCLTAGAPSGVTLVATFTPTPDGNRLTCSLAPPDSLRP